MLKNIISAATGHEIRYIPPKNNMKLQWIVRKKINNLVYIYNFYCHTVTIIRLTDDRYNIFGVESGYYKINIIGKQIYIYKRNNNSWDKFNTEGSIDNGKVFGGGN